MIELWSEQNLFVSETQEQGPEWYSFLSLGTHMLGGSWLYPIISILEMRDWPGLPWAAAKTVAPRVLNQFPGSAARAGPEENVLHRANDQPLKSAVVLCDLFPCYKKTKDAYYWNTEIILFPWQRYLRSFLDTCVNDEDTRISICILYES